MSKPIFEGSDWNFQKLERFKEEAKEIATEELDLDFYPMQIEIVNSEQMLDMCTSSGLPINYWHWSFGKKFLSFQRAYQKGQMNLAYEMVINSNPCILYCMEENSMTIQGLVLAHAGIGHNAFFKMNNRIREWTYPEAIIDYLKFAREYISECEEKHGVEQVETVLDVCHSLFYYGVDKYKHPRPLSVEKEKERMRNRAKNAEEEYNPLWDTIPGETSRAKTFSDNELEEHARLGVIQESQENILYFLEKKAPAIPTWKREIIRIVRKIAQYLFPNVLTNLMNEGFATFTHYYIMRRMFEKGLITDGAFQEFLHSHTNVILQHDFDAAAKVFKGYDDQGRPVYKKIPLYNGKNPYAIGSAIFHDIKRICEEPTEEDEKWFPFMAGSDWRDTIKFAVSNFKNDSFMLQFLSPKVMRDFRMFSLLDDETQENLLVTAIHKEDGYREDGYKHVRQVMAKEYQSEFIFPDIEIVMDADSVTNRKLFLKYQIRDRRSLDVKNLKAVLSRIRSLWNFPVNLEIQNPEGQNVSYEAFRPNNA